MIVLLALLACRNDLDQDGDGWTADQDCDDRRATVYPGADELCDGRDNDCDGGVDEDPVVTIYGDVEKGECCGSQAGAHIVVADWDGDGQNDLALWSAGSDSQVAETPGPLVSGTADSVGIARVATPIEEPDYVTLGAWDSDLDGLDDLVVASPHTGAIAIYSKPVGDLEPSIADILVDNGSYGTYLGRDLAKTGAASLPSAHSIARGGAATRYTASCTSLLRVRSS